jgi:hypothetical protein
MRGFNAAIILAATGLLPACATVVRGTEQDVSIISEPPEALARLSNGMSCTTPCKVELDRSESVTVTISKAGYEPSETKIVSKMRGSDYLLGIGGNVMVGGVVGAVLDSTNGAMRSLEPSPLHVTLRPWSQTVAQPTVQTVRHNPAPQQVAVNTARTIPSCDGVPGVPPGVSSYSVGPGPNERGGSTIVVCDDPAQR